jgi:hypothetical protein
VLLDRDAPRGVLGLEAQVEADGVAGELPPLDRHRVARHQEELAGQGGRPAWRVLAEEDHPDPHLPARHRPHVAHDRVHAVGRVGEVVLPEPRGERQGQVEHLADHDPAVELEAHPAHGRVVAGRHRLPGRPVMVPPLDADRQPDRHAPVLAAVGPASGLGHRLGGNLARIG